MSRSIILQLELNLDLGILNLRVLAHSTRRWSIDAVSHAARTLLADTVLGATLLNRYWCHHVLLSWLLHVDGLSVIASRVIERTIWVFGSKLVRFGITIYMLLCRVISLLGNYGEHFALHLDWDRVDALSEHKEAFLWYTALTGPLVGLRSGSDKKLAAHSRSTQLTGSLPLRLTNLGTTSKRAVHDT